MNKQSLRGHLVSLVYILLTATGLGFLYCIAAGHIKTSFLHAEATTVSRTPAGKTVGKTSLPPIVTAERMASSSKRWPIPCSNHYMETTQHPGCTPVEGGTCDRMVADDFLTTTEVDHLIRMANTGMAKSPATSILGPTIMDVNSGWVLAPGTHQPTSIYATGQLYAKEDYALYKDVTKRLKTMVEATFDVTELHFTAPTFITREVGNTKWKPTTMHDEYWHPHVDKNNTEHYDYSGLIYLSTYGTDFQGGQLHFYNDTTLDCSAFVDMNNPGPCVAIGPPELIVEPRKGRLIVFGSGRENPHRVTRVRTGTRYVLSFWFSCDKRKSFQTFLDGKVHQTFDEKDRGQEL